jgi:prepilin-type N-terminal cleavage/methylation domain-containing protein
LTSRAPARHAATRRQAAGFTLIEILIVVVIMGFVVSLVGGIGADRLDKVRAREERVSVQRAIEGAAFRAFAEGRETRIEFGGDRIVVRPAGTPELTLALEHWKAPAGPEILISRNGVARPPVLTLRRGDGDYAMDLNAWLRREP